MSNYDNLELNIILEEISHHASFSLGKKRVLECEPSFQKLVIRRLNNLCKEALDAVVRYGNMPFYGIRDISELLEKAKKGITLTSQELLYECQFVDGVIGVLNYEKNIESEHSELHDLVSTLTVHKQVRDYIKKCINDYGDVLDSASVELKNIRSQLKDADAQISSTINSFKSQHQSSMVDDIVTYRNGRTVILVKSSEKNSFGGIVYGDSQSGQASYIEPTSLVNANNRKQELISKESEEVERILLECSEKVKEISDEELANLYTLSLLDEIFAKASWGKEKDGIAAKISENKEIEIIQARHPLIDEKDVVSNDYRLIDPQRMLLITGPNTGGKTVSMKIIGLFVLMTYCGIPVLAKDVTIPVFDSVFVDIGDDQSVMTSLSSFSAHVKKLSEVVNNATENSLVLLDEIGSGTDPKEGESLAIAVLNELRDRKTMTVATTHYDRLKTYGKRHDDILLASVQFDMDTLTPTYKYIEGMTGSSNALEVAQKYGLPKHIINYAQFLKRQAKTTEDDLLEKLEEQLQRNQQLEEELKERLAELDTKEKQIDKQKRNLEFEKQNWYEKRDEEKREIIEQAQSDADDILKQLRSLENVKYHEALMIKDQLKNEDVKDNIEYDANYEYEVGDVVEIISSGQIALVKEVNKKDVIITMNNREMKISKSSIRQSDEIIVKTKPEVQVHISSSISSVPLECNLIGMHVDEAQDTLLSYIDNAKLSRLPMFRIIHGDGSGALRKMVHKVLSSDANVKEFRLGMPQEGGTGATVVVLKNKDE